MTDVVMPQMGESIVEGTLTKWLKKPGERVERDEPLFEISTDKVDTEIPSPAAGTLSEVLVEEGKTVGINTVVARIDEAGGAAKPAAAAKPAEAPPKEAPTQEVMPPTPAPQHVEATASAPAPAAPAPEPEPEAAAEPAGPLSPLVRKMARENNIDLGRVKGTRRRRAHHEAGCGGVPGAAPVARGARRQLPLRLPRRLRRHRARRAARASRRRARRSPPAGQAKTRIEPLSTMRIKIAEHMVMSKRTSAHVTTVHRVDMTKVAKHARAHTRPRSRPNYGFSLTYLPFITRASVVALRQFPLLNASLDGNNIIYHNEINIGIAVALENGLIVPVIRARRREERAGPAALHRGSGDARPLAPAQARRSAGRHVLHHQFRQLRQPDRHARSSTSRRWPSWASARWTRRRW